MFLDSNALNIWDKELIKFMIVLKCKNALVYSRIYILRNMDSICGYEIVGLVLFILSIILFHEQRMC